MDASGRHGVCLATAQDDTEDKRGLACLPHFSGH